MIIITWKYIGFAVILFLAGLQSIPEELFEAAAIDGASYWQIQRRITLPLLGPTIRIWAFLSIIGALQLFDLVYIIWGQYVASTAGTSTMATYMVVNGRNAGNYGYGSAVAVRAVHHLARRRPDLPAVRAAARHRGRPHGRKEVMTATTAPPRRDGSPPGAAASQEAEAWPARSPTSSRWRSSRPASPRCSTSSSAASGRTPRSPVDPSGLPNPWQLVNYTEVLQSPIVLAAGRQLGDLRGLHHPRRRRPRRDGELRARALQLHRPGAMYALFAAGLMFPITVAITPLYIMIRDLGLSDSLAGVILPQIAFGLPATIIILVPFLRAIPKELEEAAAIDGASRLGFFFRMVIPLSVPGVVTVGILAFIASWNSYILPLFILNNETSYTLPLGVQSFASQYSVDTARVLAFTSLSMIPALLFFTLFERRIVGGLTGAVKG